MAEYINESEADHHRLHFPDMSNAIIVQVSVLQGVPISNILRNAATPVLVSIAEFKSNISDILYDLVYNSRPDLFSKNQPKMQKQPTFTKSSTIT